MHRNLLPAFRLFLALLPLTAVTAAQSPVGHTLAGRVLDQNGAAVRGTSVTLRPDAGGRELTATTDEGGAFRFEGLAPGAYRLGVTGQGFSDFAREVTLTPAGAEALEVRLQPGGLAESVTVTAEAEGYGAETATTALRADLPLRDTPQSIQVVPDALLRDQGANRLEDVFRNVSGVNAFSGYQDFSVRGFRTSEVLYNGLRANPYSFFTSPKLNNVERVEVLKGPASVLYGGAEPGGLINIVQKRPQALSSREITFSLGSFDRVQFASDFTGALDERGTLLYRLNASFEDADSFRRFQEFRNTQIAPALTWRLNPKTTATLRAEYLNDRRKGQRDRGIVAPGGDTDAVPISFTANEPTDVARNVGYTADAGFERAFGETWRASGSFRFARGEYINRYHEPRRIRDGRTLQREYRDQETDTNNYAPNFNLNGVFRTGAVRHNFLAGADVNVTTSDYRGNYAYAPDVPSLDIFNPVYGAASPADYPPDLDSETALSRRYGIYVQDLFELHPKLKLLGGARYDRFLDRVDYRYPADPSFDINTELSKAATTYRGGAVYQPAESVSLYASYAEGFLPQSIYSQGPLSGGPFDPEESYQVEAGAKLNLLGGRLSGTLSAYRIVKENVLVSDPDDPSFLRLIQLGKVRSKGFEVDIAGRVTRNLQVISNYAFNQTAVTDDSDPANVGQTLPNAPRHSAGLWGRYDFAGLNLGLAAGLSFVDRRETFDRSVRLPSYVVADAALYYRWRRAHFALNLDNLFDRRHFVGGYDTRAIFPGAPRRVKLTTAYRF
jgi:iron complex outermembrane recepter protein